MEDLLSTGPTPSSLLLEAPLLLVWAWRRRKGRGGKGGLNRPMNDDAVCRAAPGCARHLLILRKIVTCKAPD